MTKIYLDSGDPAETKEIIEKLGFLDGQTTNPSLIVKNSEVQKCKTGERKCSEEDLLGFYKEIVSGLRSQLDKGQSISVEVYADKDTTKEEMIEQGLIMNTWIPNSHIKLPVTAAGIEAAHDLVSQGINVNMTLCFSVEQAMAIYAATKGCADGQVFVSPFIGRLDDIGESGMELVENILDAYHSVGSNIKVLAASIRSKEHVKDTLALGCDLITIPLEILSLFSKEEIASLQVDNPQRKPYPVLADKKWNDYNINHPLTEKGLAKFAEDWRSIFSS